MPLRETAVGHPFDPITVRPDARWCMAYAAGVPDARLQLYATDGDLLVHPLFPVSPEWELITRNRSLPAGMTAAEARLGIHVGHDLQLLRPLRAGEAYTLRAHVIAVGRRRAGATQEMLFEATDTAGRAVWQTRFSSLFLGVALVGEPARSPDDAGAVAGVDLSPAAAQVPIATRQSFVGPLDAHVYSECARIWNPIHTDVATARAAGLPAPVLHGTATLARAVSLVVDLAGVPLGSVRRIAGRFGAMVALGSTIEVRLLTAAGSTLTFDVVEQGGRRAISGGLLQLSE